MDNIHVIIKPEHIQNGKTKKPHECALALAVKDLGYNEVSVGNSQIYVYREGIGQYFKIPVDITWWIARFDAGLPVNPIEFDMDEVITLENSNFR